MTTLAALKAYIVGILVLDDVLSGLIGKDAAGDIPVYNRWQFGSSIIIPSISITDVNEAGEVSGLNNGFDGTNFYEWS